MKNKNITHSDIHVIYTSSRKKSRDFSYVEISINRSERLLLLLLLL